MSSFVSSLVKFGIVGASNTALGMGVVYASWKWAGLGDLVSNVLGYAIGFVWSYTANRRWTFRDAGGAPRAPGSFGRFAVVCAVAYAVNLLVLFSARHAGIDGFWPHLFGAVAYTCVGFLGSRFFAFAARAVTAGPAR